MVRIAVVTNKANRKPIVPQPWGNALERAVQVPILGAFGKIPAIANKRINQPTQQAHQSSFFHRADQSIFAITPPPRKKMFGHSTVRISGFSALSLPSRKAS